MSFLNKEYYLVIIWRLFFLLIINPFLTLLLSESLNFTPDGLRYGKKKIDVLEDE